MNLNFPVFLFLDLEWEGVRRHLHKGNRPAVCFRHWRDEGRTATGVELRCLERSSWHHVFVAKVLRNMLDRLGLTDVGIIAADGDWSIADHVITDSQLKASVQVIGWVRLKPPTPPADRMQTPDWSNKLYSVSSAERWWLLSSLQFRN